MKRNNILELGCFGLIVVSWITKGYGDGSAQQNKRTKSLEQLIAHVESLHVEEVAWRSTPWKTCLLEGIRESRMLHKPIVLWIFIDRPIDDERC